MNWNTLTNEQLDMLLGDDLSNVRLASLWEQPLGSIASWKTRARRGERPAHLSSHGEPVPAQSATGIVGEPPGNIVVVQPALTLDWDRYAYACDFHAPLHDVTMVRRLVQVSRELNVRRLLIGGDVVDFPSLSTKHPHDLPTISAEDCLRVTGELLAYLLDNFEQVCVLQGNHDIRLSRKLNERMSFERVLHAALNGRQTRGRLIVTDLAWCYIGDHTVAGHPTGFSKTSSALQAIAARERRNVLGAHTHLQHLAVSPDGSRWTISPGMMCRPQLTPYLWQSQGISTFADQTAGFVIVTDADKPQLFSDLLVEWSFYGIR